MNDKTFSKHKILVETMIFYKNVTKFIEYSMRPSSLFTVSDLFFLFYLEDNKSATYYQLSQSLPYNSSYISKTIKKLESKGFIIRESISNKKVIRLSSVAIEALALRSDEKESFLKLLDENGLSIEELRSFFFTMIKFSKILSNTCEG